MLAVPGLAGAGSAAMAVHAEPLGNGHGNGADGAKGTNGANGANGHRAEPAWLQRLKAGSFDDND